MATNVRLLKEASDLRERFFKIYNNEGIISIEGGNGIQVTEDFLLNNFPYEVIRTKNRKNKEYPYKHYVKFEGIEFFTISEKSDLNG